MKIRYPYIDETNDADVGILIRDYIHGSAYMEDKINNVILYLADLTRELHEAGKIRDEFINDHLPDYAEPYKEAD